MAKIARKNQKVFGQNSGFQQVSQFGSLAAAAPVYSTDPEVIQALSEYLDGWFAAVLGGNSPAIEDMNALCFLYAYQLSYIMQTGIPEWDVATVYYTGSLVTAVGSGQIYVSLIDANVGNALTDATKWMLKGQTSASSFVANGNFVAPAGVTSVQVIARKNQTALTPYVGTPLALQSPNLIDPFGNAYMWGNDQHGQLGVGSLPATLSFPVIVAGGLKFAAIYNAASSAGLTTSGDVYTWGYNFSGQLGDASQVDKSSPVLVAGINKYIALTNVGGGGTTPNSCTMYAIDMAGNAWAWGSNESPGLLGANITGAAGSARSSPVLVVGGNRYSKIVTDGVSYVAGLGINGNCYTWGANTNGQLGNNIAPGTTAAASSPVLVVGGLSFVDVITSGSAFHALASDGKVYSWGLNSDGQLGDGSILPRSSPVLVVGSHTFTKIVAGVNCVFGIDTAGHVYAWGLNDGTTSTLGTNNLLSRSSPVLISGGSALAYTTLVPGFGYNLALDAAGAVYAWGNNAAGQLGDNTVVPKSSPVLVVGGNKFVSLCALQNSILLQGGGVSGGMDINGLVYMWGANSQGSVGDGTSVSRSSPVLIASGKVGGAVNAVQTHRIAVTPGSSYAVIVNQGVCSFGNVPVGYGPLSSVTVIYGQ